jgi:FtsP/CotA-like multicopper oxidase with cupredoxin domain
MKRLLSSHRLRRRDFLKLAGGLTGAGLVAGLLPGYLRRTLQPEGIASAPGPADLVFAGTDGWIYLPPPAIPPYHPDSLAPAPFTTYIFGFRNVTGLNPTQIANQKMKAQHTAPTFWVDQFEKTGQDFRLRLTNLGLQMRPDLTDAHTIHWHGFRDAIPYFDGEPHGSVSVPIGKEFTYVYRPHEPGTYMYHCHVEDVEHVQMGMAGMVFVRPLQDGTPITVGTKTFTKFAYNDGDGSTGFDREFVMLLTEMWAEAHWDDAHIQLPEWSDYKADFSLLNGRVYPDTLAPNGSVDPFNPVTDANGDLLIPAPPYEHLQYQPTSSLVQCNEGERVLLRLANLGYMPTTMILAGIKMRVVGEDATPKRSRDGTDTSYTTNSIPMSAGQSFDAIFTAPPYVGPGPYDTYILYNRNYRSANNLGGGYGGQMTEVRVFPAGTLGPQALPNT